MYYWLFTEAYTVFSQLGCLVPSACLLPLLIGSAVWSMGADIRRSGEKQPPNRFFAIGLHLLVSLLLTFLYIGITGRWAIVRGFAPEMEGALELVVGQPPRFVHQPRILVFAIGHGLLLFLANLVLFQNLQPGGWLRGRRDQFRQPPIRRGELGSSHFCTGREYQRFRRPDPAGLTFYGAFWGEHRQRLDAGQGRFCLNGEDAARGILALGGPGSGKSQGVILPAIADNMRQGHSLIVADPQGELKQHLLQYARVTGHLVVLHDPTGTDTPRFNLTDNIQTVSDARAIADVLVPTAPGDNKFWSDSAAARYSRWVCGKKRVSVSWVSGGSKIG